METENIFFTGMDGGLYIFYNNRFECVFTKPVYGITFKREYCYFVDKREEKSRILRFKADVGEDGVFSYSTEAWCCLDGLPPNVHQIDFVGDDLYITNPVENCIDVYREESKWHWELLRRIMPLGVASEGRDSDNYGHFNSVFKSNSYLYIMAHMDGVKKEKQSKIFIVDNENKVFDMGLVSIGVGAHNVLLHEDHLYWCDSISGCLKRDGKVFFVPDKKNWWFTRGLAMNKNHIIIGGSRIVDNSKERKVRNGKLFVFDYEREKLVGDVDVANSGGIYEVRYRYGDFGISNNYTKGE